MFKIALKRSLATMAVMAGALAAAGPASASPIYMPVDGIDGVVASSDQTATPQGHHHVGRPDLQPSLGLLSPRAALSASLCPVAPGGRAGRSFPTFSCDITQPIIPRTSGPAPDAALRSN